MDLVRLYEKMVQTQLIEDISSTDLQIMLLDDDISVKSPFIFIKKVNKCIKCAANYYINDNFGSKTKASISKCYNAQKYLEIDASKVKINQCAKCHLFCATANHLRLPLSNCRDMIKDEDN